MKLLTVLVFLISIGKVIAQEAYAGRDTVVMSATFPASYVLDGSASTSQNTIINHYWVVDEDTIGNAEFLEVSLSENRNRFTLIVEDSKGNTDSDRVDIFLGHSTNYGMNRLPIRDSSSYRFFSGMNIAWKNFANDLNEFTVEDKAYFEELLTAISSNNGNAVRWWLHTNGANTPIINENGFVEGIKFETIQGMKQVLDMAYDHGVMISMCLWSFDMLQNQNQDQDAVKALLQDSTNIQSYIDNALIPVLELIGDHPAVMTWEIFNEPEGMTSQFGWTPKRIQMSDVQRFVNMCAGAIHRNTSQALVSNGAWNIQVSTDEDGFKNYYSKENLIAIGGDVDGYLDFYQVHYYPEHFRDDKSPFHRPASYWELDAPIVIGEFPADTIAGRANIGFSVERAFQLAVAYGYAGVMSWSWSDTNFNRDFNTTARGMNAVAAMIPKDLEVPTDIDINRIPQVVRNITPYRSLIEDISGDETYLNLQDFFFDEEEGTNLEYKILAVNDANGTKPLIQNASEVLLQFSDPTLGLTEITYQGQDSQGWYADAESVVMLGTYEGNEQNNAYFKPIHTSSEAFEQFSLYINDGDNSTEWESTSLDADTIVIDLDSSLSQNFIAIHWDDFSIDKYQFQISQDSQTWETLFDQNHQLEREILFTSNQSFESRYLRLIMVNEDQNRNFSVAEIISENVSDNQPPEVIGNPEDLIAQLSTVKNVNNYFRFDDIFRDAEHPEYLTFQIENSNDELLRPELSIGDVGVSLIFEKDQVGISEVSVTAIDPFGATSVVAFKVVVEEDDILGIVNTVDVEAHLNVYPNPVTDILTIEIGQDFESAGKIQIIDGRGALLEEIQISGHSNAIDFSSYPVGLYVIRATTDKGIFFNRVIKK